MGEKELLENVDKLKEINGKDILLIYYNPSIFDPMKPGDEDSLFAYIKQLNVKRITVILYGSGGTAKIGGAMGEIIKKNFDYFECLVPFSCCSSMCYIFLFGRKLILLEKANITQIDPIAKIDDEELRLIRAIKDKDPLINAQAKTMFNQMRDLIPRILYEKDSLYNLKKDTHMTENEEIELIIDLFMNKDDHASIISFEELKRLNLNVEKLQNKEMEEGCKRIIDCCEEFLKIENRRLLIVSSSPLKGYKERILISET